MNQKRLKREKKKEKNNQTAKQEIEKDKEIRL